jgi:3'(2'), 5'-bisphosphate nucleotidase
MSLSIDSELLAEIRRIARAAGDAIMQIYATEFAVEFKDDRSPLTAADRAAHRLIVDSLRELDTAVPVLSEESRDVATSERRGWRRYWLVDPLDGTKEFVKRNGEFTVNIALIDDGKALLGVVRAPALDVEYAAAQSLGAWKRNGAGDSLPIRVAPVAAPLRIVGSRSHADPTLTAYADALGSHVLKPMGSSLKICLVAEGEADVYPRLGPTSEWDTAAAQAILECAGGVMIDLDGRFIAYNSKDDLLNPHFIAFGDRSRDWLGPLKDN